MTARSRAVLAWSAILIVAFGIRIGPLESARPYIHYIDEGNYLHPAFEIARSGEWDQPAFLYPEFPVTAAATAMKTVNRVSKASAGRDLAAEVPEAPEIYDELEPFAFLLAARILVLAVSLATVVLTGVLAARLAGPRAGWTAAFLAALAPALVLRSASANVDPFPVFFTLVALLFTEISRESPRAGLAALGAGAAAGAALSSKYPAVLVFLAFVVTTLISRVSSREKSRRLLLSLAGLVVAAPLAMPAFVRHPREVFAAIAEQGRQYASQITPPLWKQAFVRAEWDHAYEHPELGVAFVLFAAAGLVLAVRSRRTAALAWGWCVWIAACLALYGSRSFQPFRNLLPLVPPGCIAIALFFESVRTRIRPPGLVTAGIVVWGVGSFGLPLAAFSKERAAMIDSRVRAVDWLTAHSRRGDKGIAMRELGILNQELRRIPARVGPRWSRLVGEAVTEQRPRWIIAGLMENTDAETVQAVALPEIREGYVLRFLAGHHPTPLTRGGWRGNDQWVGVFERREP